MFPTSTKPRVAIVGGGLAGLTAARHLHRAGIPFALFEVSDRLGGKLHTDEFEGFRLDRGFQVFFTGYRQAAKELDFAALEFGRFQPGALIFDGSGLRLIHQQRPFAMAFSRYLTLGDKLRLLALQSMSERLSFTAREESAEAALIRFGFSNQAIEFFFRPFLGGIFFDRNLDFSSSQMLRIWATLARGDTVIPSRGISAIPEQLAGDLPEDSIFLKTDVRAVSESAESVTITDKNETALEFDRAIMACGETSLRRLLPDAMPKKLPESGKSCTCLYFTAIKPPIDEPLIVLNGTAYGLVNEVVVNSLVASKVAPPGQHLMSVTILNAMHSDVFELAEAVKIELATWFPDRGVQDWTFITAYNVENAQLAQPPGFRLNLPNLRPSKRIVLAGEITMDGSIEGAMASGVLAAQLTIEGISAS